MIQPGGDPDAGMPADQAEIHGTERYLASETQAPPQQDTNEQGPPPGMDSNEPGHPPVSNDPNEPDQPPLTMSPNEQEHPPVRTSPAEQGRPPIIDSIDNIDEDMAPVDNTVDNNKNVTITSVPDSV